MASLTVNFDSPAPVRAQQVQPPDGAATPEGVHEAADEVVQ